VTIDDAQFDDRATDTETHWNMLCLSKKKDTQEPILDNVHRISSASKFISIKLWDSNFYKMLPRLFIALTTVIFVVSVPVVHVDAFTTLKVKGVTSITVRDAADSSDSSSSSSQEAQQLLEKAKALRREIDQRTSDKRRTSTQASVAPKLTSKWSLPALTNDEMQNVADYRLYIDIGREPGTWMDPRWGASGRRIEFTLDVRFTQDTHVSDDFQKAMVKDNLGGQRTAVQRLDTADFARLRQGFDQLKCYGGAYRLDVQGGGVSTARFHVKMDGTKESQIDFGDLFIPQGYLYFSLPAFGTSLFGKNKNNNLSTKEGPVTVRQMGWHTGWRREESRIVGTFKAVPIETARKRDGF